MVIRLINGFKFDWALQRIFIWTKVVSIGELRNNVYP